MAWPLTQQEKDIFIQFLEPNPDVNNHGFLKISHFSFYSSELKGLSQVLRTLKSLKDGNIQSEQITDVRYRNTLFNMGLILKQNNIYVLSELGNNVISYCEQNGLSIETYNDTTNGNHSIEIEKIILEYLLEKLVDGDNEEICTPHFKRILYNAQVAYETIPATLLPSIILDESKIYFLQLINSTGDEIKRYFRLSAPDQDIAETLWRDKSNSNTFPDDIPVDLIESMVYKYCRARAKKTIQYDIRFRVKSFLNAYHHCVTVFGDKMPYLNKKLKNTNLIANIKIMSVTSNRTFALEPKEEIQPSTKPRQRIISGCPGSGKSKYVEDEANNLENFHLIKTTFHQDSTYYDFVGTYKPTPLYEKSENIVNSAGEKFSLGKPVINYSFVLGPLIEAYLYATKNPNYNIVLIIDEINRGNVGTIFGDFFQLLDRDAASGYASKYAILPNTDLLEFLNSFEFVRSILESNNNHIKLPGNLFIWGTMNSADQGVFPIDSAFRRRWEFEYKGYNEPCVYGNAKIKYNNTEINWDDFRNAINQKLLTGLGVAEDKLIGPYFLSNAEIIDPDKVMNKLFLYLWDDVIRFQHKEMMDFNSFADLKNAWDGGAGKIFNFDI